MPYAASLRSAGRSWPRSNQRQSTARWEGPHSGARSRIAGCEGRSCLAVGEMFEIGVAPLVGVAGDLVDQLVGGVVADAKGCTSGHRLFR